MKNLLALILITVSFNTISAQASVNDYQNRSPIYDYSEKNLNNTDTIPGYQSKVDKLKITGTIYQSDGVTPAKDVILFIEQADDEGDYQIKEKNNKRYMYHRAWVKTDVNGHYTLYTFVPGAATDPITFPRRKGLKKIYPILKEADKPEYNLDALLFDDDPLLTKACRKRLKRKGIDSIMKPVIQGNLLVVNKDIVLEEDTAAFK